jgi:hypothetical protein
MANYLELQKQFKNKKPCSIMEKRWMEAIYCEK